MFAYWIRPLAIFPFNGRLEYRILSFSWFWSVVFSSLIFYFEITYQTYEGWKIVTQPIARIRTIVNTIICLFFTKKLPKLINNIEDFDFRFNSIFGEEISNGSFFMKGSLWGCLIFAITAVFMAINLIYFPVLPPDLAEYIYFEIFFLSTYNSRQIWIILYIYFCFHLKMRFYQIRKCWFEKLNFYQSNEQVKERKEEMILESARLLYAQICQLVDRMNQVFGYHICFFFFTISVDLLVDLYLYYYLDNGSLILALFIYIGTNWTLGFLVSWISGAVAHEVSKRQNACY